MSEHRKTLLVFLAHPDDESYGLGGTLARYAAEGVDVHVVIATDGAAGSVDKKWGGDRSRLVEVRNEELRQATKILGVQLHQLNYRDSGYVGDPGNDLPEAFINVPLEESVGRLVALIRTLRPQVVVSHDETGGYYHPDHIRCHEVASTAFWAAGEADRYPELGLEPFQPERLYYSAISKRLIKTVTWLMRLHGQDPTRMGRNKDIDFTKIGVPAEKITTTIDYRAYWEVKIEAGKAHGSQGGGTSFTRLIPEWVFKRFFGVETYIRVYPPAPPGLRERDFFS